MTLSLKKNRFSKYQQLTPKVSSLFRRQVDVGKRPEHRNKGNVEIPNNKCECKILTGKSGTIKSYIK